MSTQTTTAAAFKTAIAALDMEQKRHSEISSAAFFAMLREERGGNTVAMAEARTAMVAADLEVRKAHNAMCVLSEMLLLLAA